jgi:preprotein translocase subunit Sec61beta
MANDNKISMPGAFGGLVRYDEEFKSRFMIHPGHVIVFVVLVALFVIGLKIFFPVG